MSMHVAGLEGEHRYGRAGSFPTTTATTTVKASWPVDILQRARGQSQTAPPSPGRERFATARSQSHHSKIKEKPISIWQRTPSKLESLL